MLTHTCRALGLATVLLVLYLFAEDLFALPLFGIVSPSFIGGSLLGKILPLLLGWEIGSACCGFFIDLQDLLLTSLVCNSILIFLEPPSRRGLRPRPLLILQLCCHKTLLRLLIEQVVPLPSPQVG